MMAYSKLAWSDPLSLAMPQNWPDLTFGHNFGFAIYFGQASLLNIYEFFPYNYLLNIKKSIKKSMKTLRKWENIFLF